MAVEEGMKLSLEVWKDGAKEMIDFEFAEDGCIAPGTVS